MFTALGKGWAAITGAANTGAARAVQAIALCAALSAAGSLAAGEPKPWMGVLYSPEQEVFRETLDFDKRPQGLNAFLQSFRQTTNGGAEVGPGYVTLQPGKSGPSILIRPVAAGSTARLVTRLEFAPLPKVGDKSETQLGLVLSNMSQLVVELQRTRSDRDKTAARVRLSEVTPRMQRTLVERDVPLDWAAGEYRLLYHHGLLRLEYEEQAVFDTFVPVNPNTASIAGVRLGQLGVPVTLRFVELTSSAPPEPGGNPQAVRVALESTAASARLFAESQLDGAQSAAAEAVAKWRAARGEQSVDVSNAFFNLATIQLARKAPEEARSSYEAALKIREQQLGPDHPLTAELHVALARLRHSQGNPPAARSHSAAARRAYEQLFGRESEKYQAMAEALRDL